MEKEYGKFTLEQLRQFSKLTHALPMMKQYWHELLKDNKDRLLQKLTSPYYWSMAYTLPLEEQIASTINQLGMLPWLSSIKENPDPQQSVLDCAQHQVDTFDDNLDPEIEMEAEPKVIIGFTLALINTFEGIRVYGLSLNDLVKMATQGNDEALFKAVRIDRTIVSCPPIADRITLAEMTNDEAFFKELRNALKGPSKKPMTAYGPLRYVLHQLEDDGQLDKMTRKQRCDLFCTELCLYPSNNNDAEKSLDTFIRRWKKERLT